MMDTPSSPSSPVNQPVAAPPGMFGTKIPSSVSFVVAILLFLMPFVDIKCNNMSLQTVTGVELATGFKIKKGDSGNSFLNDLKIGEGEDKDSKTTKRDTQKDPNLYAMVALGLGVLGLLLSFTNARAAIGGAMVTGIGSAGALIGLMLDIKKKVKLDMGSTGSSGTEGGLGDFGKGFTDKMGITVDFTPWFYVTVVAFLAAAFFCYKRMKSVKN